MPARSRVIQDDPRLDNPAYAALSSVHSRFARRSGRSLAYPVAVVPFLGLPLPPSDADWQDAAELTEPGVPAGIIDTGVSPPEGWNVHQSFEVVQMIGERVAGTEDPEALTLTETDVPEMLELVRATNPGPFFERTIELGRYLGIRRDGELVAMAGERLHFDGWTELSAVCTADSHRGQGLASSLVSALIAGIHGRSEDAFLHVLATNTDAIRLYERLGFHVRRNLSISVLTPPHPPPSAS